MTVVIGVIASKTLVFASDGFALYQDDQDSPTYKNQTYNKIRMVGGNFLLGSAGSHQVAYEIASSIEKHDIKRLSEKKFLVNFGEQVKSLNQNNEGKRSSFILGYFLNKTPRMYLFQNNGNFVKQPKVVSLGSGADLVMEYFSSNYSRPRKIQDIIDKVISAIFYASKIPTVNCLPMISILSEKGPLDLSQKTISMFDNFKNNLKRQLILKATKFFDQATN